MVLGSDILFPYQNRRRYGMCAGQTFSFLIRFIENIVIFISSNKFIWVIYSMIYLMILIMYYKILIFFYNN